MEEKHHHEHKTEHQEEHHVHHAKRGKVKLKKSAIWMLISGVLAVILVISIFTGGFRGKGDTSTEGSLSAKEASDKAVAYINANLLQPGTSAKVNGVEDSGDLYNIKLDIGGRPYDSYITKDGGLLFPTGIDLSVEVERPAQPPQIEQPTETIKVDASIGDDAIKGDENAPVTIIEFSDFECPFCVKFYKDTLPQIAKEYIETGKVKFVYRDFPLSFHKNAQKAAEAAECAGEQEKYYEMHDKLFDEGVSGGVDTLKQYADGLGLDTAKFNECLDSGKMESEVKKDMADGSAAGVSGTPAFFINGQLVSGAQPFENFKQIIEEELAK